MPAPSSGGIAVLQTLGLLQGFDLAAMKPTTSENGFGSLQMVRGFLLNNQLTDFSFTATDAAGNPIANSVQAGKRPRSSMAPTIIFNATTGDLEGVVGSPGGSAIIQYTAKTIL